MTAEIAVMNKDAVALAADSTVTIYGKKAYHTINKLFALSEFRPVGVMIYGSAEIGGVPWETIIKVFRSSLRDKRYDDLAEYKEAFLKFIENNIDCFNEEFENCIFEDYVEDYLDVLLDAINSHVESVIKLKGEISKRSITIKLKNLIKAHKTKVLGESKLGFYSVGLKNKLKKKYSSLILDSIEEKLEKHSISEESKENIILTILHIYFSEHVCNSGVVFAGFGENNWFPKLVNCEVEGVVNNKLKYFERGHAIKNNEHDSAVIMPFAERETVTNFIEGVSTKVRRAFSESLFRGFQKIQDILKSEVADKLNEDEQAGILSKLDNGLAEVYEDVDNTVRTASQKEHINTILESIEFLPKHEMAEVAESLVSLTSFRQKISLEQESVGGEVDVAVISKSDGFVWIKRKHYFDSSLNPMFMSRYTNR